MLDVIRMKKFETMVGMMWYMYYVIQKDKEKDALTGMAVCVVLIVWIAIMKFTQFAIIECQYSLWIGLLANIMKQWDISKRCVIEPPP